MTLTWNWYDVEVHILDFKTKNWYLDLALHMAPHSKFLAAYYVQYNQLHRVKWIITYVPKQFDNWETFWMVTSLALCYFDGVNIQYAVMFWNQDVTFSNIFALNYCVGNIISFQYNYIRYTDCFIYLYRILFPLNTVLKGYWRIHK